MASGRNLFTDDDNPPPSTASDAPPVTPPDPAISAPPEVLTANAPPPGWAGKRVFVLDAHSMVYRAFHGMPPMTSPDGRAVGAVYGFFRDVCDLLDRESIDGLFAAFDAGRVTFRSRIYQDYKAHRDEMPTDLQGQVGMIRELLDALGVPAPCVDDFEADDILATIARVCEENEAECILVTSDKDCRQLLSERVSIYHLRDRALYGPEQLYADWRVRPDQVVDFQTLVGDSVDNIPGVPGIGAKTAGELLDTYGTLENLLAHTHEIKAKKRRESLEASRDHVEMTRKLVRLDRHVPVWLDWEGAKLGNGDPMRVEDLTRKYGFRGLGDRLRVIAVGTDETTVPEVELDTASGIYHVVDTQDALQALVKTLEGVTRISIDTETTSVHPRRADLVGVSICVAPGEAYYIPVRAPLDQPRLSEVDVVAALKPVLENPAIAKVGQNLKYDLIVFRGLGIEVAGLAFDTLVADYLLSPGERTHNLDDQAKRHLGYETISITSLIGKGRGQLRMDQVDVPKVAKYAGEDAEIALRLAEHHKSALTEEGLLTLLEELEIPLIDVLAEMEFHGIRVDPETLTTMQSTFGHRLDELRDEMFALAGMDFNPDSPKQLGELLFEKLGFPVLKRNKSGPSTDAEVLEELAATAGDDSLPARLLEYRRLAKLKGTYIDGFLDPTNPSINPLTGRVHTSFMQDVAATGRLSSKDPNLQNIPIRTTEGRQIRSAFRAGPEGWKLLSADYSQVELRILAHYCGDPSLREAFAQDQDIHTRVASEVNGVPLDQVTSDQRRQAKTINFAVIYGQSPFGLSKQLGIDKATATAFIEAYFRQYGGVTEFIVQTLDQARQDGFVSTAMGRRRPVEGIRPPYARRDNLQRNQAERIAVNAVIQGTAADLIKRAMIVIHRRLKTSGLAARMLLTVHDELVFETPAEEVEALAELVRTEMAGADDVFPAGRLAVPLRVDVKVGDNWADSTPLP